MSPSPDDPDSGDAVARFERSMAIDCEKWRDGIGYDLDSLDAASPTETAQIENLLLQRGVRDWRDVEALARIDSPDARAALREAVVHGHQEVRLAVVQRAPALVSDPEHEATLVSALERAEFYGGLRQALEEAASFHPPAVLDALFRGALRRVGGVGVHFAALLTYLHGAADEPFDWSQRPFFLRFATSSAAERETAFRELCARIRVSPDPWLGDR